MSQVKQVGKFQGNVIVAEMHTGWLSLTGFSTSGIENIFWVGLGLVLGFFHQIPSQLGIIRY